MQWDGISGGSAPIEFTNTVPLSQHKTEYTSGGIRELAPMGNRGGMLEMPAALKVRKGQQQGAPVAPLPTSAGILRPLVEVRAEQPTRRSDQVSADTWTTTTYAPCDTYQPNPLHETQTNRVEKPHMQMTQASWDPLGPQFQGYGASHALPTEYMLSRRSARGKDQS